MNAVPTPQALELQQLLDLCLRLPMAVVWCVIIGVLAIVTLRGGKVLFARRLAGTNAAACFVMTVTFAGLVALQPAWFADWMRELCFLVLGVGFLVGLNALLWGFMKYETPADGWRHFGLALAIGGFVVISVFDNADVPIWLAMACSVLIVAGVGVGYLLYERSEGRMQQKSRR
jgi:hypothetical protein